MLCYSRGLCVCERWGWGLVWLWVSIFAFWASSCVHMTLGNIQHSEALGSKHWLLDWVFFFSLRHGIGEIYIPWCSADGLDRNRSSFGLPWNKVHNLVLFRALILLSSVMVLECSDNQVADRVLRLFMRGAVELDWRGGKASGSAKLPQLNAAHAAYHLWIGKKKGLRRLCQSESRPRHATFPRIVSPGLAFILTETGHSYPV